MASISISGHRVDAAVTGFLADAGQGEEVLIAQSALPEIRVDSKRFSGILYSQPLAAYLGDGSRVGTGALVRAPNQPFAGIFAEHNPTKNTYECISRGGKSRLLSDLEQMRWDFSVEQIIEQSLIIRRTILLDFELHTLGIVNAAATWPDSAIGALPGGGGIAWDVVASTPIQDGLAVCEAIRTASGVYPDYAIISHDVLAALRTHQQTLGALGTLSAGLAHVPTLALPDAMVLAYYAEKWRLPGGVYASDALHNSANPGQALSIAEMAAGFAWFGCKRGVRGAMPGEGGVALLGSGPVSLVRVREYDLQGYRWRENDPPGDYIAGDHSYVYVAPTDMNATAFLLTGVV